jgi:hypothetical protein
MLQLQAAGRRNPHPANYRGCKHAKAETQKKKTHRTPKATTGRVFPSNRTTRGVAFAAALRGSTEQQQLEEPNVQRQADGQLRSTVSQPLHSHNGQVSLFGLKIQTVNL